MTLLFFDEFILKPVSSCQLPRNQHSTV